MSPKIVDKAAKRNDILHAALRVFARKGFKNTRVVEIAEEAGIGKGTIYEYFRHKDEMLIAAFQGYIEHGDAIADSIMESDAQPIAKLREIITKLVSLYGHDAELTRVFFDFWVEGMQNGERTEIDFAPVYAQYRTLFQRLLDEAIAAGQVRHDIGEHTASVFIAVFEGMFLQWLVDPKIFVLEESAGVILETLLNGILVKR